VRRIARYSRTMRPGGTAVKEIVGMNECQPGSYFRFTAWYRTADMLCRFDASPL